jgi:hypothetical protein
VAKEEDNSRFLRYPSTAVSWNIVGNRQAAVRYLGAAKQLLWSVKNRMRLGGLKSFADRHQYSDGTEVKVWSTFGQDFIKITVGGGFPSCIVQLYDLPKEIPPMMWYNPYHPAHELFVKVDDHWTITKPNGDTEVEGIDYVKTYYSYSMTDCPSCSPLDFTIGKSERFGSIPAPSYDGSHRPFIYKSEKDNGELIYNYEGDMVPHFMGYGPPPDPPVPEDPLNHVIYSFWGDAGAEILLFDSDDKGSYFLWKAYTEWASSSHPITIEFSATGLGYMLMKGFINNGGIILCESKPSIIKVDCCLKTEDERQVRIWVPSEALLCIPGAPFMFVDGRKYCEPPDTIGLYHLMWAATYKEAVFWLFPDIFGGCIPMEWTITGPGSLITGGFNTTATYKKPDWWGQAFSCDQITITVRDRCGTEEKIITDCCGDPRWNLGTLLISYDSLLMGCGTTQEIVGMGGCPPYSWSISGVGSLVPTAPDDDPANARMTYHGPATNSGCDNSTITLTDCCGDTVSVSFALNCWSGSDQALILCEHFMCEDNCPAWWRGYIRVTAYNCDGNVDTVTCYSPTGYGAQPCDCSVPDLLTCLPIPPPWCMNCPGDACDVLYDIRTPEMIEGGCCPLNPLTGLPY